MPGFNINGDGSGPASLTEVVRTHRWRLEFDQIHKLSNVQLYALSCQRPSMQIDTNNMHYKQNQIRMPAKYRWNPINVKFYETADFELGVTTSSIFDYWANNNPVVNFNTNTINNKFRTNTSIYLETGDGSDIHLYVLNNAWPSKVDPSELSYANSDISTIQVTLTYDSASEKKLLERPASPTPSTPGTV